MSKPPPREDRRNFGPKRQGLPPRVGRLDAKSKHHHGPRDAGAGARGSGEGRRAPSNVVLIWGTHAVAEALGSPRRTLLRLCATAAGAERVAPHALARGMTPDIVAAEAIAARIPKDAVHQGLLLEARPLETVELDELPDNGTLILLDQVTDPHNVGAILRTAAAFGVAGLVTTERHAPDFAGTLAKAASGGLEHVPVALVVNLARALDQLGDRGFQRIGLDSGGDVALESAPLASPLALVLGAEGQGLRRLTRERCDLVARLDMPGRVKSLNVSNACAVALAILRLRS